METTLPSQRNVVAWIFQGNPKHYDIDKYFSRQTFVYWNCPRFASLMQINMPVFFKRSGPSNGIVALGKIVEIPKPVSELDRPEFLGTDLWNEIPQEELPKVGIQLEDVRLTAGEGMISWNDVSQLPSLTDHPVVKVRIGTIFRLGMEQSLDLHRIWGNDGAGLPSPGASGQEGNRQEVRHIRIERNQQLIQDKKQQFLEEHGLLKCEICNFQYDDSYPAHLAEGYIEVHHLIPLAELDGATITNLTDLICVCANCHRMIHRTKCAQDNYQTLLGYFSH
jgi:hypothetical protein